MVQKRLLISILLAVFALAAPFLIGLQGQITDKKISPTPPTKSPQESLDDVQKNFPSVEYATETTDEVRRARGAKYDKYKILDSEITEEDRETSFADWLPSSSPLPISDSEIIVLGNVGRAQAYLSPNKNSVYSEFKIDIEKTFKNQKGDEFGAGKSVIAEREGGIVSFPSCFKTWYFVSGQQMPKVGGRYLLFLTHRFTAYGSQEHDLFLLTGYELREGKVFPLDNPDGGTHPVATFYRGKEEATLINDLKNALRNSLKTSTK